MPPSPLLAVHAGTGERSKSNNFTPLQLLDQLNPVGRSFFPFISTQKGIVTYELIDYIIRATVSKQTFTDIARVLRERRNNWIVSRALLYLKVAEVRKEVIRTMAARSLGVPIPSAVDPTVPPNFFTRPGGIEVSHVIGREGGGGGGDLEASRFYMPCVCANSFVCPLPSLTTCRACCSWPGSRAPNI